VKITPELKAKLEAAGHEAALSYVDILAQQKRLLDQTELREMHRLIFARSWPEIAGKFRTENVDLTDTSYLPPHWQQVPTLLYQSLGKLSYQLPHLQDDDAQQIIELAAQTHYDLTSIHPFRDGNGRIARLSVNYIFRYFDLPYVVIPKQARERYLDALEVANQGNMTPFIDFIAEMYERSLDQLSGE
jgi:Fic family protein